VVTAFEVFEHLRDPVQEASELARVLRRGGLLYATTPNFNSLSRRLLGPRWNVIEYPEHLCYFSPKSIERWLSASGFTREQIETTGLSVGRLRRSLGAAHVGGDAQVETDEALRTAIESSPLLSRGKRLVNAALSTAGLGDTLKIRFRRS
jgi:hypothetical protein